MSFKYKISFLFCIMTILAAPGCKKNESTTVLRPLTSYIDYQETKQGVTVRAKELSLQDCKPLLGNRASLLFKKNRRRKPIIPIQLSITNKTNHLVVLQQTDIDLELTDCNTVASRLRRNSFMQAFGELFAGIAITGILAAGSALALSTGGVLLMTIGSVQAFAPVALIGGSAMLAAPLFLIVGTPVISTIKVVETAKQNKIIKKEIEAHTLQHTLLIEPYQTVDTLIFVGRRHYQQEFTIALRNPKNPQSRIPFGVKLQGHE